MIPIPPPSAPSSNDFRLRVQRCDECCNPLKGRLMSVQKPAKTTLMGIGLARLPNAECVARVMRRTFKLRPAPRQPHHHDDPPPASIRHLHSSATYRVRLAVRRWAPSPALAHVITDTTRSAHSTTHGDPYSAARARSQLASPHQTPLREALSPRSIRAATRTADLAQASPLPAMNTSSHNGEPPRNRYLKELACRYGNAPSDNT